MNLAYDELIELPVGARVVFAELVENGADKIPAGTICTVQEIGLDRVMLTRDLDGWSVKLVVSAEDIEYGVASPVAVDPPTPAEIVQARAAVPEAARLNDDIAAMDMLEHILNTQHGGRARAVIDGDDWAAASEAERAAALQEFIDVEVASRQGGAA